MPAPARKVGEVRLISRGNAVVVQTLLSTRLLSRVIAEIGQKEKRNWPENDAASRDYMAALAAGRLRVEKRDTGGRADRRRRLLIEFAADEKDAVVLVGTYTGGADTADLTPRTREVFSTLALPRAYVLRNIRLILADSFHLAETDVDRLGPLGAAASQSTAPSTPAPKVPSTQAPGAPSH